MSNLYINTDKPIAEKKIFYLSMFFPVVFLVIIWSVKLLEISFNTSLAYLGVYPQKLNGLVLI